MENIYLHFLASASPRQQALFLITKCIRQIFSHTLIINVDAKL